MSDEDDRVELPPISDEPKNLDEIDVVQIDEFGVFEWHEEKDGKGKPTMIVLMFSVNLEGTEDMRFGLRLKSRKAASELIEMLRRHRDLVWP